MHCAKVRRYREMIGRMAFHPQWVEGLGIPEQMVQPGTAVMVAYTAGAINGDPALICYATVRGLAAEADAAGFNGGPWYWLDVHIGAPEPLPQMFRADQILGVPALGLAPAGSQPVRVTSPR